MGFFDIFNPVNQVRAISQGGGAANFAANLTNSQPAPAAPAPAPAAAPANPWAAQGQTDANGYQITTPADAGEYSQEQGQSQYNIGQMQNQLDKVQGDQESGYPAYPNSFGLGATPGNPSDQSNMNNPLTVNVPDTSSRGFNPWSLMGESNARGR